MKEEMTDITHLYLHDLRAERGDKGFSRELGHAKRVYLTKAGRLEIETDLAYELTIYFSKDDLYRLLHRLVEIKKTDLEQTAKRRAKAQAKHSVENS